MPAIEIDHVTEVRPSEDEVCAALRRIDPWGPQTVAVLPDEVLAVVLPAYQTARDASRSSRFLRRAARRAWQSAIDSTIRQVRSRRLSW